MENLQAYFPDGISDRDLRIMLTMQKNNLLHDWIEAYIKDAASNVWAGENDKTEQDYIDEALENDLDDLIIYVESRIEEYDGNNQC